MRLNPIQTEAYQKDGILRVEGALSDGDLQPVLDELTAVVDARAQELHAEGELPELHEVQSEKRSDRAWSKRDSASTIYSP